MASLRQELFFSPGGGIPTACEFQFRQYSDPPKFWVSDLGPGYGDVAFLCVYGLPLEEPISLSIYGPDQTFYSTLSFTAIDLMGAGFAPYDLRSDAGGVVGAAWDVDDTGLMELYIWDSATVPTGQWRAVGESGDSYIEGYFDVSVPPKYLSVGRDAAYDPFLDDGSYPHLAAGDIVVIAGAGFVGEQSIALGIYYLGEEYEVDRPGALIDSQLVRTQEDGGFVLRLPLPADLPPGFYSVVTSEDSRSSDSVAFNSLQSFVVER